MKKNLTQRFVIIALVTLASLYVVLGPRRRDAEGRLIRPQLSDFTYTGIKNTLRDNIRLGLDLRGGLHLVMQVQMPEYLTKLAAEKAQEVGQRAQESGYVKDAQGARSEAAGSRRVVTLKVDDAAKAAEARDALEDKVDFSAYSGSVSGDTITWTMNTAAQGVLAEQAVEQAQRIIDSRINAVGVAEPTLQRHGAQGSYQILLQMPGEKDPERIKKLISAESRLELAKVAGGTYPQGLTTYATKEEAEASLGGQAPSNRRVLPYVEDDEPTAAGETPDPSQPKVTRYVIVESPAIVEGSDLREATARQSAAGGEGYEINFALKPAGAQKFGAWTAANVNAYMAVVLNDTVKSAPYIKSQITDSGQITGNFTKESAEDLSLTLRSGALPAKLVYLEERTVGPSLGADSIRSGVLASVVGLVLVIIFMVIYYRGAGLNAVVALLLNMLITVAALVLFDAALTLPGIAGLILSIGMTVDTNVLIFERIREELATGKTVPSSVEQGFARAFVTVIDTHVTTIVSSLFLFLFGTSLIRGFAVTLILGLIANLFSAVYVSRTIFISLLSRKGRRVESLSI
ncbi:MAG: protein translocase subunit SecD [Acidobacteria bacterium]|nr:protein translocase subunit SecD [Acidobacteriota bacterium]